jgi:hypothetical protein
MCDLVCEDDWLARAISMIEVLDKQGHATSKRRMRERFEPEIR